MVYKAVLQLFWDIFLLKMFSLQKSVKIVAF